MSTENLSHEEAVKVLCDCAATVTVLSYQEVIEGYFSLRGLPIPAAQPPQPQREGLRELLIGAFEAGAMAVHEHWQKNPGPAQNGDPEFGEAAHDCADDFLSTLPAAASVEAGERAQIVAFIKTLDPYPHLSTQYADLASRIERGDHLTAKGKDQADG